MPLFNPVSPLTTKGDLFGFDGTTIKRIPVGTDGQVVVASSSATNGVTWGTPAVAEPFLTGVR